MRSKIHYTLPEELIAKAPASPRDYGRLFVYDTAEDKITFDVFQNLDRHLPQNSFLVLNKTKVVPARILLKKETGGKVEILFLMNELLSGDVSVKGLSDRKLTVGQKLYLSDRRWFMVIRQNGKIFYFQPNFSLRTIEDVLKKYGTTPIPKYIKGTLLNEHELRKKYQTVFAEKSGSIAAPTASLHFTDRVFRKLDRKGIPKVFVTLHVGLGTFSPIGEENLKKKKLFPEYYEISKAADAKIRRLKKAKRKLIAVGTTTVRTLESGGIGKKVTELFIFSPYRFKMADGLITNFHLPGSSLMMLVDAFLRHKKAKRGILDLYRVAIENKFRFYSFGDAMLIV